MVKDRLHGAMVEAMNDPQVKQTLGEPGFEVAADKPEQFGQFLDQELARCKQVIEARRITME